MSGQFETTCKYCGKRINMVKDELSGKWHPENLPEGGSGIHNCRASKIGDAGSPKPTPQTKLDSNFKLEDLEGWLRKIVRDEITRSASHSNS